MQELKPLIINVKEKTRKKIQKKCIFFCKIQKLCLPLWLNFKINFSSKKLKTMNRVYGKGWYAGIQIRVVGKCANGKKVITDFLPP